MDRLDYHWHEAESMKLSQAGGNRSFEARLRLPSPSPDSGFPTSETERGFRNTSLERFHLKKGTGDCDICKLQKSQEPTIDTDGKKHEKLKVPKYLGILFFLSCLGSVVVIAYLKSNSFIAVRDAGTDDHHSCWSDSGRDRSLQDVRPERQRMGSTMMSVEVAYPESEKSVTGHDLPKGAQLLGILQLKRQEGLKIGLVNIDEDQQQNWQQFTQGWATLHVFPFEPVDSCLQWSDLYPEWIDETLQTPTCPRLPMPSVAGHSAQHLHVVIVKAPSCGRRDVTSLQILLSAATVASNTSDDLAQTTLILIISECRPLVSIFSCDELLEHEDDLWLFEVNLPKMRKRLALPVGSCELAFRVDENNIITLPTSFSTSGLGVDRLRSNAITSELYKRGSREAYATLLHSDGSYVCGAIVLAQSIRATGSQQNLVALVDDNIPTEASIALQRAGWVLHTIDRIRNPKSQTQNYNAWNYSKFRLWQLTQYEKIIYLDADLLVLQNLDFLFGMPQLSATGNHKSLFNSGVMVVEPSSCTFAMLMEYIDEIESYNGGDQGYLNEVFPWWYRIPKSFNYLKHFWSNTTEEMEEKTQLFQASDPSLLHVIHYLGRKPWLCYRDYDCNWNFAKYQSYASDHANARWWAVHDGMPTQLQEQCLLQTRDKADFEINRRKAQTANFSDGHWKINITDPRLHICSEEFCDWQSMLADWDKPVPHSTPMK